MVILDHMVEQIPLEWKNVSPEPYPWKKSYFWKNKTFFGPTFPFPWSPGLSSLTALGRQLSCQSRKVKSCPSESFVPPRFHAFIGNPRRIYIPLNSWWELVGGLASLHPFLFRASLKGREICTPNFNQARRKVCLTPRCPHLFLSYWTVDFQVKTWIV